jgi:RNA polymerase sigma factor (sigma-70 family)
MDGRHATDGLQGTKFPEVEMSDFEVIERWTDERLLREANAGNTDAFAVFCVRSLPSLRRYVRFQLRRHELPVDLMDDFCHESIIKAIDYINSCKVDGGRPLPSVSVAWIKQIAFNAIRDFRRRDARVAFVPELIAEARKATSLEEIEEYEEIVKFFQWLGQNEQDMLEMVLVEHLSIVDAGTRINLEKWAAYKTYERGLQHLRDLLKEHGSKLPSWVTQ